MTTNAFDEKKNAHGKATNVSLKPIKQYYIYNRCRHLYWFKSDRTEETKHITSLSFSMKRKIRSTKGAREHRTGSK